jgi:hypothetical protein
MNLDISEKTALQLRALLLAASMEDRCPYEWLAEWWPTPSRCDVLVDLIDKAQARYDAAQDAYFASLFGETK